MKWISLAASVACAIGSSQAMACGNFFGTSVLEKRQVTLDTLWDASFSLESTRLMAAPNDLVWTDWDDGKDESVAADEQAAQLRERTMTAEQRAVYQGRVDDGEQVKAGALSATLADYALGAHHYKNERFAEALQPFKSAAAKRATKQDPWPLVAEYMLGRSYLALGNNAAAAKAFESVKARAQQDESDPLSLGARSLSEAATAHQRAGEWVQAIQLQMAQAALNVPGANISLRWRIEAALKNDKSMNTLLADPLARDAVILYALAYLPAVGNDVWSMSRHDVLWEDYRNLSDEQRAALPADLTGEDLMTAIARALKGVQPGEVRGADRLSALYYRQGQYEAARPFAAAMQTPLAFWVSAKLALRDGDRDQAREFYSKAIAAFPALEDWGNDALETSMSRIPACRANAEVAILTLQNGDVVESLELFLRAGAVYWNDTAYLAERVLKLDELSALVDRLPSLETAPSFRNFPASWDDLERVERRGELVEDPRAALSNLLARRLMRAERFNDAIPRFTDPALRAKAENYKSLLAQAETVQGPDRAKLLFEAAKLARHQGMALLAFESSPDWAVHSGQYARPSNFERLSGYVFAEKEEQYWTPGEDVAWIGEQERQRVSENSGQSSPRFTYRLTAAELANKAADALPKDSQAFASVLCHATSWLLSREPELARKYYRRYQSEGRAQSWGKNFGGSCPAPMWG